jgi:hypothetical protein
MIDVDRTELRKWRRKSPAIIAGFCGIPLAWHLGWIVADREVAFNLLLPVGAFIVSYAYEAVDIRGALWKEEMASHVGAKIKDRIIAYVPVDLAATPEEIKVLREEKIMRRMNGVFWEIIDQDDRLRINKDTFYENGKYYTTAFDLFIICGILGYVYLFGLYFENSIFYLLTAIGLIAISMIAWYWLIPKFRLRHLKLSEEQLEQLVRYHEQRMQAEFRSILAEMRATKL